jgi:hypothetical protein
MIYILIAFFIAVGYYTFTYGLYLLKKEKNKLAAAGTIILAIIGTAVPVVVLFLKY